MVGVKTALATKTGNKIEEDFLFSEVHILVNASRYLSVLIEGFLFYRLTHPSCLVL